MSDKNFARGSLLTVTGLHGLVDELGLKLPAPALRSEIVSGTRRTVIAPDRILEQYPKSYLPEGLIGHLRFAMRYEPLDLGLLQAAFALINPRDLESWIRSEPTGVFARRAWYLFELLTGKTLDVADVIPSGYADLLDPELHVTGPKRLVRRQRINDNLLGTGAYSPLVRRTTVLDSFAAGELRQQGQAVLEGCDPALLSRAVHYLFTKETKSSFAIEGEAPGHTRTERFVAALRDVAAFDLGNKNDFVRLQNSIVDPRYAQSDWRTIQNYVSRTLSDYTEDVHFVSPKPEDVPELMTGWMEMARRLEAPGSTDPVVAAAATAFGFVFIHPFDDGNGRIHRFLVHHMLATHGFTPAGILFPISAPMLRNKAAYDRVLERYSSSIMPFIEYDLDRSGRMQVSGSTAHLYRFFDATAQSEYLYQCVEEAIRQDLREEIGFLEVFDAAIEGVKDIVDMPDRRASLLVRLILQNNGKLSAAKRAEFSEIKADELERIEAAIRAASARLQPG